MVKLSNSNRLFQKIAFGDLQNLNREEKTGRKKQTPHEMHRIVDKVVASERQGRQLLPQNTLEKILFLNSGAENLKFAEITVLI